MAVASAALGTPVRSCKLIDPVETYNAPFGVLCWERFLHLFNFRRWLLSVIFQVRFDEGWWSKYLLRLKRFYFGTFLPMAARRILRKWKLAAATAD